VTRKKTKTHTWQLTQESATGQVLVHSFPVLPVDHRIKLELERMTFHECWQKQKFNENLEILKNDVCKV
jgi:hypothetical protein